MRPIRYTARVSFRLLVVWLVDMASLAVAAGLLPGIVVGHEVAELAAAALLLGIVNLIVRPVVLLLALPFGFLAVLTVGFFVNALALLIASRLLPVFEVNGWLTAFVGGFIFSFVNTVITEAIAIDDDDSFYQGLVERLAQSQSFEGAAERGRGLVMMEIDGLSYHHLRRALAEGYLPTLKRLIEVDGYRLSHIDCGLPSQTSACQAGIMFGDNHDIPSFRWYAKDEGRLYISGRDAPLLNARFSQGRGLMRGGASINNLLNGDAEKSILTLADLFGGESQEKQRRAEDIYLLMLNPYFIMRTLVLFLFDAGREVVEYVQDIVHRVQPRLNRLRNFYPLVRAATTVLMRDVAAYLTMLDIVRGAPAIYVTWPGYDEVAHHSLPWSRHAFRTLRQYDRVIARVLSIIERKAPRPYDLIILSDHGQSSGATFLQRYGYTLKDFIEQQLPAGARVAHSVGGDDGMISVAAMAGELHNIQEQGVGGHVGRAVVRQARRAVDRSIEQHQPAPFAQPAQVTVCGSGNLAQVYFDLQPRRLTLTELEAAYPGMVNALVQHPGIGFVVGCNGDGEPLVLGKSGTRNLHIGEVSGADPLQSYGDTELRAWQVRRIADFPHAGDLIVNSTLYADGTVAAMEELIGSHGGLGGEQTDAFILHPGDMTVTPTRNAIDVFAQLDARRGLPPPPPKSRIVQTPVDAWKTATLVGGLKQLPVWPGRALRALALDRRAYKEVADDPFMTGPAVLLLTFGAVMAVLFSGGPVTPGAVASRLVSELFSIALVYGAARLLGGRRSYTTTLRVVGFAQAVYVLAPLTLIQPLAPLARLIITVVAFVAVWLGASEAHALRGWRGLVLPVVALATLIVALFVLATMLSGAALTLEGLMRQLGLISL